MTISPFTLSVTSDENEVLQFSFSSADAEVSFRASMGYLKRYMRTLDQAMPMLVPLFQQALIAGRNAGSQDVPEDSGQARIDKIAALLVYPSAPVTWTAIHEALRSILQDAAFMRVHHREGLVEMFVSEEQQTGIANRLHDVLEMDVEVEFFSQDEALSLTLSGNAYFFWLSEIMAEAKVPDGPTQDEDS